MFAPATDDPQNTLKHFPRGKGACSTSLSADVNKVAATEASNEMGVETSTQSLDNTVDNSSLPTLSSTMLTPQIGASMSLRSTQPSATTSNNFKSQSLINVAAIPPAHRLTAAEKALLLHNMELQIDKRVLSHAAHANDSEQKDLKFSDTVLAIHSIVEHKCKNIAC